MLDRETWVANRIDELKDIWYSTEEDRVPEETLYKWAEEDWVNRGAAQVDALEDKCFERRIK